MPGQDDDLLARLNALKPSSVTFTESKAPSIDVETAKSRSREDKLADRLKGLRSGSSGASSSAAAGREDAESLTAGVSDEVATEPDPIKEWQRGGQDEGNLEDLLAELGSDDQWTLDADDPKHVDSLLNEAKAALQSDEVSPEVKGGDFESRHDESDSGALGGAVGPENEDQQDETNADDYVKRVLAELIVDKRHGSAGGEDEEVSEERACDASLGLPSTPSTLPQPPRSSEPPSYEDSELEARFSSLGLDLPSTPNTTPSSKAKTVASAALKKATAKSNLPAYTDEDIDSWCCICNEDGTLRCLGCDGDIYCNSCWREGHGEGPGQERGHRAVQYNRKGPAAAAA